MRILSIKSRQQILKDRENAEEVWTGKNAIFFITPTPKENIGPSSKYRAKNFIRMIPIVTKKIDKKAVVRNKLRRRLKEAFRAVDRSLLKEKYDYQILARHSLFQASFKELIKDLEKSLRGEAMAGIAERSQDNKKKKRK